MRRITTALAVLALAVPAAAIAADPALYLAARFAARPAATQVAMSPSGAKIVYLTAYRTGGRVVIVADVATGAVTPILPSVDVSVQVSGCTFKTETRLVCRLYAIRDDTGSTADYTRVIAIDTDGKNLKLLGEQNSSRALSVTYDSGRVIDMLPDDPNHVLMTVQSVETSSTGTLLRDAAPGLGVALVDIRTGQRRLVVPGNTLNAGFGADGHGNVRLRAMVHASPSGYMRDRVDYAVRGRVDRDWRPLGAAVLSDDRATSFEGFDASGEQIYQLKALDGRKALYSVATDGSGTATLVFAHPKVDVDGVLRIGKYNRPVAAEFSLERGEVSFFDGKLASLSAALRKALPGRPVVSIRDESWDGVRKLVYVDGDNTPGCYYLYDGKTKQLGELVSVYPQLDGVALGSTAAVSYLAQDGTRIPGYLTLPPGKTDARGLPGIVMPHGGPSARDTAGFDWLAQFFAAQGYAVLQPNFRGSSGYGDEFFAKNGFQSWRLAIGDVNDGARWLVGQGADTKRLAIVGWSYGGYAALQANVVEPGLYRATIAIAPVTDLTQLRRDALRYTNFKLIDAMIGTGPHVVAGSPARHAASFTAPVLLFHADKDLNVDLAQSRTMAAALKSAGKRVDFVQYKNLDHQIDDSAARRDMLSRSAAFLAAELK